MNWNKYNCLATPLFRRIIISMFAVLTLAGAISLNRFPPGPPSASAAGFRAQGPVATVVFCVPRGVAPEPQGQYKYYMPLVYLNGTFEIVTPVGGFCTTTPTVATTTPTVATTPTPTATSSPSNQQPSAASDGYSTDEDTGFTVAAPGVLANDTDADGDPLTAVLGSGPAHGTLALDAGGSFIYTPDADYHGTDGFTYQASDGTSASALTTVSIIVDAVNDPPQVSTTSGSLSYTEGDGARAIDGGLVVDDVDSATLAGASVEITTSYVDGQDVLGFTDQNGITGSWNATTGKLALAGMASLADYQAALRSVTYINSSTIPSTAARAVTFTVDDGAAANNTATATRTIAVSALNSAPVLHDDGSPTLPAIAEDVTDAGNGGMLVSALIAGGDAGATGGDYITDGDGGAVEGLAVTGRDNANGSWQFSTDGGASWIDFGLLSDTAATLLAADAGTTMVRFVPDTNWNGAAALTFRAWDQGTGSNGDAGVDVSTNGGGTAFSSAGDTAGITVDAVDDVPVAMGQAVTADEDTAKLITLAGTEPDGDALSFTITSLPAHGTLYKGDSTTPADRITSVPATLSGNQVTYMPDANYSNTGVGADVDSFQFTAHDGTSASAPATVSVAVNAANDAPSDISLSSSSVDENQAVGSTVGTFSATDADGGTAYTYSLVAGAGDSDNASFTIDGDALKTAAVFDFETKTSYTIHVQTDDGSSTFQKQFTISIANVNDAPSDISLSLSSVAENQAVGSTVGTLSTSDADAGATHSYSLVAGAGDTDNAVFTIDGDALKTAAVFDFETKASYTIRVQSDDGNGGSFAEPFTITINNLNDPPVLVGVESAALGYTENDAATAVSANITLSDVDSPTLMGATVTISAGYASGQDVLEFADQLGIAGSFNVGSGELTLSGNASPADYQAALRAVRYRNTSETPSTANRTISFRADDGAASDNLSNAASRQVTITAVNDAPANTVPAGQTVNEDTDLVFSSAAGTAISIADVDAASSAVKLSLDVAHGTLTLPSTSGLAFVDGTGNGQASVHVTGSVAAINTALSGLKYRGTQHYNVSRGAETLTVVTNDQGNTGTPGAQSDTDTVGITVTAVNDAPTATAKSFTAQANMKITGLSGLLTGASDPDTGDGGYSASFTVGTVGATTPAGATISNLNTTAGSFDFDPPPGATGDVTFTFTVCDSGNPLPAQCSAPATVTVSVSGPVIWFVNPAVAGPGDGRLSNPFKFLSGNSGTSNDADDVDAANQRIFVYSGTATGGITLNASAWLIGQGVTGTTFDTLMGITPPAGTIARPALGTGTATVQGTVTLASSVVVKGLAIASSAAVGLADPAGAITGVSVDQVAVTTTTGTGVNLSDIAGTLSFTSLTTTGGTGANLTGSNGGATFNFTGVSVSSGANPGFVATGGGTVNVTGSANTLATTTGTALNVTNTTIGASGLTFRSISAGTAASGPATGIVLNNTGTSGGLTVTGNGGTCTLATPTCTGGTIQSTTSDGIVLDNTKNVSLSFTRILNAGRQGIWGKNVNGFTLTNSLNIGAGDGDEENGILFENDATTSSVLHTGTALNGTFLIQDVVIDNATQWGFRAHQNAGTVNMTLRRVTVQNNINTWGEFAVSINTEGTGTANVLIDDSDFLNVDGGVHGNAQGTGGAVLNMTVQNSNWNESRSLPFGLNFTATGNATARFKATGNTMVGCAVNANCSQAIDIDASVNAQVHAIILNNTATQTGIGGGLEFIVNENAFGRAEIRDNIFTLAEPNKIGVNLHARNVPESSGQTGQLHVTIEGNTVNNLYETGAVAAGYQLLAGSSSGTGGTHPNTVCVNTATAFGAGNNSVNGTNTALTFAFIVRMRLQSTFQFQGYTGASNSDSAVAAFVQANNSGGTFAGETFVGTGSNHTLNYTGATCQTPATPSLP